MSFTVLRHFTVKYSLLFIRFQQKLRFSRTFGFLFSISDMFFKFMNTLLILCLSFFFSVHNILYEIQNLKFEFEIYFILFEKIYFERAITWVGNKNWFTMKYPIYNNRVIWINPKKNRLFSMFPNLIWYLLWLSLKRTLVTFCSTHDMPATFFILKKKWI